MRKELDLVARTRRFLQRSGQLLQESEKLTGEWQKLIDDQTAKTIKRIAARLKSNGRHSGSTRL
jgi:cell division protein FtsL